MNELQKYYGKSFQFAEVFTCYIDPEGVFIEQYGEGRCCLKHIKTEQQLKDLHRVLTGVELDLD